MVQYLSKNDCSGYCVYYWLNSWIRIFYNFKEKSGKKLLLSFFLQLTIPDTIYSTAIDIPRTSGGLVGLFFGRSILNIPLSFIFALLLMRGSCLELELYSRRMSKYVDYIQNSFFVCLPLVIALRIFQQNHPLL